MDLRLREQRIIDLAPMQGVDKQWLLTPSISFQTTLDIPVAYQKGLNALYVKKCVRPKSFQGMELELDETNYMIKNREKLHNLFENLAPLQ